MEKNIFIPFPDSWGIPCTCVYPEGEGPFPAVLMVHGFMTSRNGDRFMWAHIAEGLAAAGIASYRIDEVSMGENKRSRKDYCLSNILEETKMAFNFMKEDELLDKQRLGLMGHSMGGRVVLYSAGLDPKVIVSLNGALTREVKKKVVGDVLTDSLDGSKFILLHTSDGRTEMLFDHFDEDMFAVCANEFPAYDKPLLVAYASKDPTCNPQISIDYFAACTNPNKEILCIPDCNHTFNAKTGDYTKLNELIAGVVPWLKKNL